MSHACYHCNTTIEVVDFTRHSSCTKCGRDTRVCRNCLHYAPSQHRGCREPQVDLVADKETANFCDYFKPAAAQIGIDGKAAPNIKSSDQLKKAADALFRKKAE